MATGAVIAAGLKARPKEHSGNYFQPASAQCKPISFVDGGIAQRPSLIHHLLTRWFARGQRRRFENRRLLAVDLPVLDRARHFIPPHLPP